MNFHPISILQVALNNVKIEVKSETSDESSSSSSSDSSDEEEMTSFLSIS